MELQKIPGRFRKDIILARNILKKEGCKSVYVFGSLITGKIHKDTDIDIGITGLPAEKFFKVYSYLDGQLHNKVDLIDFDENKELYNLLHALGEVMEIG